MKQVWNNVINISDYFTQQDFVCPSCQLGFIEELPENAESSQPAEEEPQFFRVLHDMNQLLGPLISGSFSSNATTR